MKIKVQKIFRFERYATGGRSVSVEIAVAEAQETIVRPQNLLDWIAFVLLLVGAFAWGYFVTDVNILDVLLERIWDPLDDVVFVLIALSGLYWLVRVFTPNRPSDHPADE